MQGASTSRDEPMAAVSKFTLRGLIACALVLLATPALAASQKAHDDCNAEDPDRNIAGCTRIIADRGESKRVRGIAHVGRGLAWINKGELDRAIADFTQAIRLNPKDALAYSNRGLTWADKGDFDRAIVTIPRRFASPRCRAAICPEYLTSISTTTAALPGPRRAISTVPSPTTMRRSAWTRALPLPTTRAAWSGMRNTCTPPSGSIRTT
jgi:hypothetical protein